MAQVNFGSILREARERKGYDLASAARRLRIRPDILRAIEETDFERMPPRGYTRNMVNAYARFVGLNPTELTRMYLDQAYAYQVGRAREVQQPPTGFDMGRGSRTQQGSTARSARERTGEGRSTTRGATGRGTDGRGASQPQQNALGRALYDDRAEYSRDFGMPGGRSSARLYSEDRTHPSRHAALPSTQYTNFYAGPSAPSPLQSKLPFLIAGVVIVVVLAVVLFLVFGNQGSSAQEDVPKIPISGLADPEDTSAGDSTSSGESAEQTTPAAVAPTMVTVVYEVASGTDPWIEVYENNSDTPSSAGSVQGPHTETLEVSGVVTINTPQPDSLTVTVDGEPIQAVDNSGGYGVYSYIVDFPAILEAWHVAHPEARATSTSATASTATTSTTTTTR